jgi:pilus assembly protein Flp/PilA
MPRLGVKAMRRFFEIFKDEQGATAVEYGLIITLIFLAMIVGVTTFAQTTIEMWDNVASNIAGV